MDNPYQAPREPTTRESQGSTSQGREDMSAMMLGAGIVLFLTAIAAIGDRFRAG
ncbi:MAG TPA: hypothetical protein VHC22_26115 [Pirellulales bacterium]|nr:hypothetical protein [Pirellulales bacterium]